MSSANGGLPFQGVILDVDGTLVDSNDAHALAFEEAFRESGEEVPFERIRPLIGKGSDKLMPELIGRYDEALAKRKTAIFKARYLPHLQPFAGVRELLSYLKRRGVKLAVASSAGEDELDALLEAAGARDLIDSRTGADDAEGSKPDPDIVQAALAGLGVPAARCIMVGDTPYDAEAAARAGVPFIGLLCGGWPAGRLQPAMAVRRDPADLLLQLSKEFDS